MRGPDFAEALVDALAETPMRADTMVQLRLEIGMIDRFRPGGARSWERGGVR